MGSPASKNAQPRQRGNRGKRCANFTSSSTAKSINWMQGRNGVVVADLSYPRRCPMMCVHRKDIVARSIAFLVALLLTTSAFAADEISMTPQQATRLGIETEALIVKSSVGAIYPLTLQVHKRPCSCCYRGSPRTTNGHRSRRQPEHHAHRGHTSQSYWFRRSW